MSAATTQREVVPGAHPRPTPAAPVAMAVAAVLLLAVVGKLRDYGAFLDAVRSITLVPNPLILPGAIALIVTETLVAVLLIHRRGRLTGAILGSVLFGGFLVLNAVLVIQGAGADCACFGVLLPLPRGVSLALDVVLLAGCALLIRQGVGASWRETTGRPAPPADAVVAAGECRRASALPLLCFVLSLALYALVSILPNDPVLYARITRGPQARAAEAQRRAAEESRTRMRLRDPAVGSVLPIPAGASGGLALARGRVGKPPAMANDATEAVLVVFFGSCSGCVLSMLRDVESVAAERPWLRAVAVSSSTASELDEARARFGLSIDLVSDAHGDYSGRYSAAWTPRAYVLKPSGELCWCQAGARFDPREIAPFVDKVVSQWVNGHGALASPSWRSWYPWPFPPS